MGIAYLARLSSSLTPISYPFISFLLQGSAYLARISGKPAPRIPIMSLSLAEVILDGDAFLVPWQTDSSFVSLLECSDPLAWLSFLDTQHQAYYPFSLCLMEGINLSGDNF